MSEEFNKMEFNKMLKAQREIVHTKVRALIDAHDIEKNSLPREGRYTHSELTRTEIDWLVKYVFSYHAYFDEDINISSVRPGYTKHGTVAFYVTYNGKTECWGWNSIIRNACYYGEIEDINQQS